jgi:hypothetical protein
MMIYQTNQIKRKRIRKIKRTKRRRIKRGRKMTQMVMRTLLGSLTRRMRRNRKCLRISPSI